MKHSWHRIQFMLLGLALRRPVWFGRLLWAAMVFLSLGCLSLWGAMVAWVDADAQLMGLMAVACLTPVILFFLHFGECIHTLGPSVQQLNEQLDMFFPGRVLDLRFCHRITLKLAKRLSQPQWQAAYFRNEMLHTLPQCPPSTTPRL